MKGIRMQGGIPLQGKVRIQGSKNAVLPILAATLLTNEVSYIQNCPRIADVHCFVHLLRELGCLVHWQEKGIRVQPGENEELPCERAEARRMQGEAITGMRSSLCLLGALLGRCGYVTMEHPGGCIIGERPIDLHIRALQQMGVEFREEGRASVCTGEGWENARGRDHTGVSQCGSYGEYFAGCGEGGRRHQDTGGRQRTGSDGIVRISDGMWCTDRRNRRNGTIGSW